MSVDTSLVDRIVRGVLQQLQGPADRSAPKATASESPRPAAPTASVSSAPSIKPTTPLVSAVAPRPVLETRILQPVVTADVITGHLTPGTTHVVVTAKAVVTPAAIDLLRARKLAIRREAPAVVVAPPVKAGTAIVVRSTPVLDRLLGKSDQTWKRELLGCPDDAANLAIAQITRGEIDRVVIFASQTFRAACLANRNSRIKAVAISSVEDLKQAAAELRVNVVCIDPTNRTDFEITRLLQQVERLSVTR